jgi:hypothetical protein
MHHHKAAWIASRRCSWTTRTFRTPTGGVHIGDVRDHAGVRRRDVDSLMRLILDLRRGAAALTKTWWVDSLWNPSHPIERYEAERQWGEYFGGTVTDHLDQAIPRADAANSGREGQALRGRERRAHGTRAKARRIAATERRSRADGDRRSPIPALLQPAQVRRLDHDNARRAGRLLRTVPRAVDAGGLHARAPAPHSYSPMSQPAERRSSIMWSASSSSPSWSVIPGRSGLPAPRNKVTVPWIACHRTAVTWSASVGPGTVSMYSPTAGTPGNVTDRSTRRRPAPGVTRSMMRRTSGIGPTAWWSHRTDQRF